MAATATWYERNGASGSTTDTAVSDCDWKNTDDATASRASYPVTAGNNSYHKNNFIAFTGVFNQISNVLFAHTAGTLGTGLTLKGKVTTTYTQGSTTALGSSTDITATSLITAGMTVTVGTSDPSSASSSSISAAGYTEFIVTQVQSTASAAAGDSGTVTLTVQYDEN